MSFEKFLDTPLLRNMRNAAATIRAVAFFGGIVLAGATLIYLTFGRDVIEPDVALTAGIGLTILATTIVVLGYYNKYHHDPPFYEILELEGMLVVEPVGDHHRYVYTRRQRVRATRDDLRLIEIRGHWTGVSSPEKVTVEPLVDDHVLLDGHEAEEDGRVHRWIYPCRAIGKDQTIEAGLRQEHEDDVRPQKPYFREGGGRYRTKKITVAARFPKDEDPRALGEVEGKVWSSNRPIRQTQPIADLPVERKVNRDAGTVDYVVLVERPKLYHSYGLMWKWARRSDAK